QPTLNLASPLQQLLPGFSDRPFVRRALTAWRRRGADVPRTRREVFRRFEQALRGGRIGDQIDAVNAQDLLDDRLSLLPRGASLHVVAQADVLRRPLRVPGELLRDRVMRIEVQIAEQSTIAGPHVAQTSEAVLIVARRGGAAFGMVDV